MSPTRRASGSSRPARIRRSTTDVRLLGGRRSRVEGEPAQLAAGGCRFDRGFDRRFDERPSNPFRPGRPGASRTHSRRRRRPRPIRSRRPSRRRCPTRSSTRAADPLADKPLRAAAPRPPEDRRRGAASVSCSVGASASSAATPKVLLVDGEAVAYCQSDRCRLPARAPRRGICIRNCPTPHCLR